MVRLQFGNVAARLPPQTGETSLKTTTTSTAASDDESTTFCSEMHTSFNMDSISDIGKLQVSASTLSLGHESSWTDFGKSFSSTLSAVEDEGEKEEETQQQVVSLVGLRGRLRRQKSTSTPKRSKSQKRSKSEGRKAASDDKKQPQQEEGVGKKPSDERIRIAIRVRGDKKAPTRSRSGSDIQTMARKSSKKKISADILEKAKQSKKGLQDFFAEYDAIHAEEYRDVDKDDDRKSLTGW